MALRTPIIIVNFKTYAVGTHAETLAKQCEQVSAETGASIAVAVSPPDLQRVSNSVKIPVLCQHMDPEGQGSFTGKIIAESILENGGAGTLMNHSEDRYMLDRLESAVARARQTGLISVVCAADSEMAEAIATWDPDMIAVEPPELIGGDVSVSSARPEVITDSIEKVHRIAPGIPVLCGAGIKTADDFRKAVELGAAGVLLASGIVKAQDPVRILKEMAEVQHGR